MKCLKVDNNKDYISPWKLQESDRQIDDLIDKDKPIEEPVVVHEKSFLISKTIFHRNKRKQTMPAQQKDTQAELPRSLSKIFNNTLSDFRRYAGRHLSDSMTKTQITDQQMKHLRKNQQLKLLNELIFVKKCNPFTHIPTIVTLGNDTSQVLRQTALISKSVYLYETQPKTYFKRYTKKRIKSRDCSHFTSTKMSTMPHSDNDKDWTKKKVFTISQLKKSFDPSNTFFPAASKKINPRIIKTRI